MGARRIGQVCRTAVQLDMLDSRDKRFLGMCTVELGLGALAIALGWLAGVDPRSLIPAWSNAYTIGQGLIMGAVAGVLLALAMQLLGTLPIRAIQSLSEKTESQLRYLLRGFSVPQLIVVALTAGVGEELLFRGLLMQGLVGDFQTCTTQTWIVGLLLSSLAFGLAHPMSVTYIVFAFIMGCAMGFLHWYFQNLLVPIVAHWVYDAIIMVWLVNRANSTITRTP